MGEGESRGSDPSICMLLCAFLMCQIRENAFYLCSLAFKIRLALSQSDVCLLCALPKRISDCKGIILELGVCK